MSRSARIVGFIILFFIVVFPLKVRATITSCTASVSSSSAPSGSAATLVFTVTNGGDGAANWVKIERPSSNFSVTGGSADGWTLASSDEQSITLTTNTPLASGQSVPVSVDITSVDTQAGAQSWIASMNDGEGGSAATCGGDTGVSIAPVTQPGISLSNLVVSDVTDSSVKVIWDTDGPGNSSVDYGADSNYGSNTSDGTMGTSHSITLSGLSANTTYHYDAKSTDANGNTTDSGDNSFVTAQTGTTSSNQTGTVTTTTTTVIRPTPSPTPTPDITPPRVTVKTDFTKPLTKAPEIDGSATDPSGVAELEYSLDGGRTFQPVDTVATPGMKSTAFSFSPVNVLDDNYEVAVRATDGKGNVGVTKIGTMVIDRLPPRFGGFVFSFGSQEVQPMSDGSYLLLSGLNYKITLSSIGGPLSIDINSASDTGETNKTSLVKNSDNGLWSGTLMFPKIGIYTVSAYGVDGANNKTNTVLTRVTVFSGGQVTASKNSTLGDAGKPIANGELGVYYLDDVTKHFMLWDGASYGQRNPQSLTPDGRYSLYLPGGTYYLRISAPGYKQLITSIFTLTNAGPVASDFILTHARVLMIGPWFFTLPDFGETTATVSQHLPVVGAGLASSAINHEFPYFSFPGDSGMITSLTFRGKPTIVTLLTTWLPQAATQLGAIQTLSKNTDINTLIIVPHESASAVSIFAKRAGYTMPIVADPDGDIVEAFGVRTFPALVVVNRKGTVQKIQTGIYSSNELLDMIVQ